NTEKKTVKISLSRSQYEDLIDLANDEEVSLKKLIKQSIKKTLEKLYDKKKNPDNSYDSEGEEKNRYLYRNSRINISTKNEERIKYNFKIQEKQHNNPKDISIQTDIKIKYLLRDIILYYNGIE